MKKDIILAGVGGQGILSIATIIGDAAAVAGLSLKQAEVHGMSQRGGDVQSNLRLSTETIHSDLIKQGTADLIISMEPMEALRYVQYLHENPNYPEEQEIAAELAALPHTVSLPIDDIAKTNSLPKSANVILLGMAAKFIEILSPEQLRESIARVFARKGEEVVKANQRAFDLGLAAV